VDQKLLSPIAKVEEDFEELVLKINLGLMKFSLSSATFLPLKARGEIL